MGPERTLEGEYRGGLQLGFRPLKVASKPSLESNICVGTVRLILKIPHVFLRLNAPHRLDLESD